MEQQGMQYGQTNFDVTRLIVNLLTKPIAFDCQAEIQDPEINFLFGLSNISLFMCAVSYQTYDPLTMLQLAQQQESAYAVLFRRFLTSKDSRYFCIPVEIENCFATLIGDRTKLPGSPADFTFFLNSLLTPPLTDLFKNRGIRLHTVYSYNLDLKALSTTYSMQRNALDFFDYIQQEARMVEISTLAPRQHIGLYQRMDDMTNGFINAFLQNSLEDALSCVNQIIENIIEWVPFSKDILLADIQFYFDNIINSLTAQFGPEVQDGISVAPLLFETHSLEQLQNCLSSLVKALFVNAKRHALDTTVQRMLDVRDYIEHNICSYSLSAGQIAEAFSISPQLLSIQFKKCFGVSPIRYIEDRRMELAKDYLLHSDLSIQKIGEMVGISNASTLHRTFFKHCGQSPGKYRSSMKHISSKPF